nr:hypothetical protein CFP56_63310 [Quercus suber]
MTQILHSFSEATTNAFNTINEAISNAFNKLCVWFQDSFQSMRQEASRPFNSSSMPAANSTETSGENGEPTMASSANSSSSSSSATTGSTTSSLITHGVNHSLLLLSNMASMATVKLDYNNYMVCKHQIEVILVAYSMINFINDDDQAPDPFLKDSSGNFTTVANPDQSIQSKFCKRKRQGWEEQRLWQWKRWWKSILRWWSILSQSVSVSW